jgi:hypothetical protein
MAQTNTELSVEIICRLAENLNQIIRTTGEIQINNKTIWDNILHRMDNSVWRGVLETLATLYTQQPSLFKNYHVEAITEGLQMLDKFEEYYDKVLDMKTRHLDHKKTAWRCLMATREIYNSATDTHLPNSNRSKVKTQFGDLFDANTRAY